LRDGHCDGIRPISDIAVGLQQFGVALETGDTAGVGFDHCGNFLQRAEKDADQQQEADKAARGQRPFQHKTRTRHHHHNLHETQAHVVDRTGLRHDRIGRQFGPAIGCVVTREQRFFVTFIGKGLHDPDAADGFLQAHVKGPHTRIDIAPRPCHARAVDGHHPDHQRHDHDRNQGERDMQIDHQRKGSDKGDHRDEQIFGPVVRDLAYFFKVAGHSGDKLAGARPVIPAPREPRQMRKGAAAHLGLDLDPQTVPPIDHHPHQGGIDQIHQQQPNRGQYGQPQIAKR